MNYTEELIIEAIRMYQRGIPLKEIKDKVAPERKLPTFEAELCGWRKILGIPKRSSKLRGWFDWDKIKQGVGLVNPK